MSAKVEGTCGSRRSRSKERPEGRRNAAEKLGLVLKDGTPCRFRLQTKMLAKSEARHTLDELAGDEETKRPCRWSLMSMSKPFHQP